jgi:hypothetical protein
LFLLLTVIAAPCQQVHDGLGLGGVDMLGPVTGNDVDDEPEIQPGGSLLRVSR